MAEPVKCCYRCRITGAEWAERWGPVGRGEMFRLLHIPNSATKTHLLCLICWGELLLWLHRPPTD